MYIRSWVYTIMYMYYRLCTSNNYTGFLSGGGGSIRSPPPPLEAGCPLERPTNHILILYYIWHCTCRKLRRRKQSLSLLVFNSFCYLSSSIHVQAPYIHCVVDLSLQIEADSLFTGLAFPAELSNYICYCTWSQKPLEAVLEAENIKIFQL